jgi:hypothetical protein
LLALQNGSPASPDHPALDEQERPDPPQVIPGAALDAARALGLQGEGVHAVTSALPVYFSSSPMLPLFPFLFMSN